MSDDIIEEELQIARERGERDAQRLTRVLQQPIGELATLQPAVILSPDTTVRSAVAIMNREAVSCVLIVEHERLVGVFTERDVLTKVVGQGLDLDLTPVSACMTSQPVTLGRGHELAYALHEMGLGGYRHIPLLDDEGCPVGLVSMRLIVEALSAAFPEEMLNLPPPPWQQPHAPEGA